MKLLIVLSRFPYPLDKGDKLRAYYQIRDLANTHQISLVCLSDSEISVSDLMVIKNMVDDVHIFRISRIAQFFRAFLALFSSQPIQVRMFYSKRIQRKINTVVNSFQPDHIYCQLIRTSEYVKNEHNILKTIDYMDALSTGMMRMSADSGFFMKRIYKIESKRLARYENLIFDYFDHHTIISQQDQNLIYHPDRKRIHVIPNGVNIDELVPVDVEVKYDIVFHGNMNYPPNVASALYIGNRIKPLLNNKIRILLSGTSPHPSVIALNSEQIIVSGWVDDIRKSYNSAKIFVAPMLINTGLQNKILEAMCLGVPCITTTMANNAIGAIPDEQIIIADNPESFAKKIDMLLNDEVMRERLSINARQFVLDKYNWHEINNNLSALFMSK